MRALVFTDVNVVQVLDVPDVEATSNELVIHVERSGICGSELHGIRHAGFRVPPLVLGHEFVGRTSDGRRVAVNPLISCGTCTYCLTSRSQLCAQRVLLGAHRAGGAAERVTVPSHLVHDIPDELDMDRAGLIEPVANALHAWRLAGEPSARRVAIIGCGAIGLACLEVARHFGASYVTGVDLAEERRTVALGLGADEVTDELTDTYDVIFDAVGTAATHAASVRHLVAGGTTVWLGLLSPESGFDAVDAVRWEKNVRGMFAYDDRTFVDAIALAPHLDLRWATTVNLEEGADIFTRLMNGASTPIKVLLAP